MVALLMSVPTSNVALMVSVPFEVDEELK